MITIHSVSTTPSVCANQGTATILATSTPDPFLMYELISGPSLAPRQNSSTFSALFPGTYTARIYDINDNYIDRTFTISGNYQLPDLTLTTINPTCPGQTDGSILAPVSPGTGRSPFSWEIVSPSPSTPQASSSFKNLPQGTYVVKVTDACNNYQTKTVFLTAGSTGLRNSGDSTPYVNIIGCDTGVVSMNFFLLKEKAGMPLTISTTTSAGTRTRKVYASPIDTVNFVPGWYSVYDTVPGITYGSFASICISDTCGTNICGRTNHVNPFTFDIAYDRIVTCDKKIKCSVVPIYTGNYHYTDFKWPVTLILKDALTNATVDSSVNYNALFYLKEQISGKSYVLKVVDGCGKVFQKTIVWPTPSAPFVDVWSSVGCMDSTATSRFGLFNFNSYTKLEILSGPPVIRSTKPHYEFSDTLIYPKVFISQDAFFDIKNMAQGTYTYRASDTCGNVVSGSFTVLPEQLADFRYSYGIKKGCLGNNIFSFDTRSNNTISTYIYNADNGNLLYQRSWYYALDSLTSLPNGKYILKIHYGFDPLVGGFYYTDMLNDGVSDCWALMDTIEIDINSTNSFQSHTTIYCNGTSHVEINVDSTRAVAPFQFEIISGPQTFPWQNSNVFTLPSYGIYDIRIRDACNNTSIRQISVDSARFPPVVKRGASCSGSKIILKGIHSTYFTYKWYKPDGTVITGDSIVISPLTAADTGVYIIEKTVHFNNCTDIFTSTYHLSLFDVVSQEFCDAYPVRVGTNLYTLPGLYVDTLTNALGCDSIVQTRIVSMPQSSQVKNIGICYGDEYPVGDTVYKMPGIYKDSIRNKFNCYDIIITNLRVYGIPDTITHSICEGEIFTLRGRPYYTSGFYTDTLVSAAGCDSLSTLHLTVHPKPILNFGNDTSLCATHSLWLHAGNGYASYSWNGGPPSSQSSIEVNTVGTYWAEVKNNEGCKNADTIRILSINPLPVPEAGVNDTLCQGEQTTLNATGGIRYQWYPGNIANPSVTVRPSATTLFYVEVFNAYNCAARDSVEIFVHPVSSQPLFSDHSIRHCFDDGSATLSANWGTSFLWSPGGDTTQSIVASQDGTWQLTVWDQNNCTVQEQIVLTEYCETKLFVPEAFSPNGDGLHEDLEIFGKNFTDFSITIFNRWGEIIFVSNDRAIRWNGMYRNEEMPVGSYPWIIRYKEEFDVEQKEHLMKGSITLIR